MGIGGSRRRKDLSEDLSKSAAGTLAGRRILITGAASGIGLATARKFAMSGAKLALLDRDSGRPKAVGDELKSFTYELDLSDEGAICAAVVAAAKVLGGLDGVVNCAGIGSGVVPISNTTAADWNRVLAINLTAPFLVVREAVPYLLKAPGIATIVNIASGQGLLPSIPGMSPYATSKGGLITLSKSLAVELAPVIRVNSVCPGVVDTPLIPSGMKEVAADPKSPYAMKRIAEPEEIADAVLFLTSAQSTFITGIALAVDGGRTYH